MDASTGISAATVAAAAAMAAAATAAQPMEPNSPQLLTWDQTPHPDFQADMAAASARRQPRSRQVNLRPVLLGLLLLALIPLAWWLWTSVRPGPRSAAESVEGTVVTLPTLMATSGPPSPDAGGAGVAVASPEAGGVAVVEPTAQPTAEPTLSDLERIAATATALFADATVVTDCTAPSWWVAYTVEEGDTIEALATTRGILPEALIVSNCLAGSDLPVGALLMLPPVGVIAFQPETATPTPTPTSTTAVRPTRGPGLPTRPPVIFPTPTFPVIIILTPQPPTAEPTEPPPTERPVRPTTAATTTVTLTPPNPLGTATPQSSATLTPPVSPTSPATLTPPGTVTPTLTPPPPPTSSP